jgi:AcrR family transcriptional regulator
VLGGIQSCALTSRDRPRAAHADDRREALLEAAHAEFATSGYQGATTAHIAKRAGISQSYVYALFPSKKDLFLACQRRNHQRILRILDAASAAADEVQAQAMLRDEYLKKVDDDRIDFLFRLQATAAATDPDIAAEERRSAIAIFDRLMPLFANNHTAVKTAIAIGLFTDMAIAVGLPPKYWPTTYVN